MWQPHDSSYQWVTRHQGLITLRPSRRIWRWKT